MARYTALFDACVLYSGQIRDLLISLARTDTFTAKWSDRINDEWVTALVRERGLPRAKLLEICVLMERAVPDAVITGHESLTAGLQLPDTNDNHILAAAISGRCDVIVTFNLKHFPASYIADYGIEVQTPDIFIANLYDLHAEIVDRTACAIIDRLIKPSISKERYLENLRLNKMPLTADLLAQRWEIERGHIEASIISLSDVRQNKSEKS